MNSLFPSKILVRTGPAYMDKECTDAAVVEVNLLPPGESIEYFQMMSFTDINRCFGNATSGNARKQSSLVDTQT